MTTVTDTATHPRSYQLQPPPPTGPTCRSCGHDTTHILNLGKQYLADFRADRQRPPRHPLDLWMCPSCTLLQLSHAAPPDQLYHPRYSFKSGVNPAISADLKDVVEYTRTAHNAINQTVEHPTAIGGWPVWWLDIASNDGTLLSHIPTTVHRVGIDPLRQFHAEAKQHADRIVPELFHPAYFRNEQYDAITSVSMFYDLDDPNTFVEGVRNLLAPYGVWTIQQNYLPMMLGNNSFDNVSHEHVCYYSVRSMSQLLERHGLQIADVTYSSINGGCFRTLVTHDGAMEPTVSVARARHVEHDLGIDRPDAYWGFIENTHDTIQQIRRIVDGANQRGETVDIYGASTRGGTIWQAVGLGPDHVRQVVDRNPDKTGTWMSAIDVPIVSEEQMRQDPPAWLLVGPWWFRDQFIEREAEYLRGGGKMIIPLPHLEVVGG